MVVLGHSLTSPCKRCYKRTTYNSELLFAQMWQKRTQLTITWPSVHSSSWCYQTQRVEFWDLGTGKFSFAWCRQNCYENSYFESQLWNQHGKMHQYAFHLCMIIVYNACMHQPQVISLKMRSRPAYWPKFSPPPPDLRSVDKLPSSELLWPESRSLEFPSFPGGATASLALLA